MKQLLMAVSLVGVVIAAGCMPADEGVVAVLSGPPNVTSEGFHNVSGGFTLNGSVEIGGGHTSEETFENIVVCLYTADGTLLNRSAPNDMHRTLHVELTANEIPKYIVIDSPDFWNDGNVRHVEYYVWQPRDSAYRGESATNRGELPVQGCAG